MTARDSTFYVLRYLPGTDIRDAKHAPTLGRYGSWADAEDARLAAPRPDLLEVYERREAGASA